MIGFKWSRLPGTVLHINTSKLHYYLQNYPILNIKQKFNTGKQKSTKDIRQNKWFSSSPRIYSYWAFT